MKLPQNFKWINDIGQLPDMIIQAIPLLGIAEIKGQKSNPAILKFADELGVRSIYTNDDTSWCALAHNAIALRAGKKVLGYKDRYDILRALAFRKNGVEINVKDWRVILPGKEMFGDTLIFKRPGGGHIGFYIGESDTHYYVMGGNQNNMYSFTRIAKYRLAYVRRPMYNIATPESVKKYILKDDGVPITSNEA